MDKKKRECALVLSQEQIADQIFSIWLESEKIAEAAGCGQFVSLYCEDSARMLPRPISICEIDREHSRIRLVYRVTGKNTGTEEFSKKRKGDRISILGPLGNGFPMEKARDKSLLLIGGGIGVPPLLQTAKEAKGKVTAILGYREEAFLLKEFEACAKVYTSSETGKVGIRGNVLDVLKDHEIDADLIFSCGPAPMLRAVKRMAEQKGIPCWISMEERMACGIGACLACVCESVEKDEHTQVKKKRVCCEGPVFFSTEVEI